MTRGAYNGGANAHCKEMDEALEANPPKITWEKRNGVMVATEVNDPHTGERKRGRTKKIVKREETAAQFKARMAAHALELEEAQCRVLETLQTEADQVADRFKTHRANNTRLLNAARTI